ncbi:MULTISPECIES: hypothetical protein [Clostridium]|uniref:Uncharacterized protein n=1 Tax=Clostridium cadaveris TaxID=1529 RepID=A0A1I2NM60_9CLOT|nr:hypothetical protein [Clostridium cadaveris]MDU4953294.1 hypothetical protein [Clostridium sp.]MDM8313030.1 hypothetical protein [Clostridium cadaveris]MDY4949563.1 hypothetical protein [Clostridium cadaveris]NME65946.1 hypothetical protein [Clostridium cadaveris]PWL54927.1 MAG: hypothetical protein DBY38_02905 [Clostridium cadaveris]
MINIKEVHEFINSIYENAENAYKKLSESEKIKCTYTICKGNYIKIGSEYRYQHYGIPIIVIEGVGDIGFNMDGIFFEFFLDRDELANMDFNEISNRHVEIYGAEDCSVDYYKIGDKLRNVKRKIEGSTENSFGIAFYYNSYDVDRDIIEEFMIVKKALKK